MNINSINNTSFQAKLDVSKVRTNKARWQNIAKAFSEQTKGINETMRIEEMCGDTVISGPLRKVTTFSEGIIHAMTFNTTVERLLKKFDDNTVAKKLAKLLDIGSVAESRKKAAQEVFEKRADKQSWLPADVFRDQLALKEESISSAARNKAHRDAFWKNFEIVV